MINKPPAIQETQETWIWSLGQEDPLEKVMAIHFSILAWETRGQRSLVGYIESEMAEVNEHEQ